MKRTEAIVAVGVLLSLTPLFPARADLTMTVLRESYHAWGYVSQAAQNWDDPPLSDQYDVSVARTYPSDRWTSSVAVGDGVIVGYEECYSEAGSGAWRYGNQFYVSHNWHPHGALGGPGHANARLQADLLFAGPDAGMSILGARRIGSWCDDGSVGGATLTDLVTGISWDIASVEPLEYTWPCEKTHVYRLEMYVEGSPYKSQNDILVEFQNVSNVVAAVPLPGAALLGIIGLNFAGWRLRRRR